MSRRVRKYKNKVGFYKGNALDGRFWVRDAVIIPTFKTAAYVVGGDFTGGIAAIDFEGNTFPQYNFGTGFTTNVGTMSVRTIHRLPDGGLYVGGNFNAYKGDVLQGTGIIKLLPNGDIDNSFVNTATYQQIQKILVDSNDKIYIFGNFNKGILRLNTDGTVDTAFDPGTGFGTNGSSGDMQFRSDGTIVATAVAGIYRGISVQPLVRINTNGAYMNTYGSTGFNSGVTAFHITSNDEIFATGNFTDYRGTGAIRLAKITASGDRNGLFNTTTTGLSFGGNTVNIDNNGDLWVGGGFNNYKGTTMQSLVKINPTTAALDTSFANPQITQSPFDIINQVDGKIVVGGAFSSYKGESVNQLFRIDTNGYRYRNLNNPSFSPNIRDIEPINETI
jgi:hypothetical protein